MFTLLTGGDYRTEQTVCRRVKRGSRLLTEGESRAIPLKASILPSHERRVYRLNTELILREKIHRHFLYLFVIHQKTVEYWNRLQPLRSVEPGFFHTHDKIT